MSRELTRQEKTAIHKLVTKWCANYDKDYGCLWTVPAICWASAGRALIAAISVRRCCPLILCWEGR